jgi:hypothetical protein
MVRGRTTYSISQVASAILMMVMLLWLTISAPFVYAGQQEQNKITHVEIPGDNNEDESPIPLTSTNEEKKPSGSSLAEEFIGEHNEDAYYSALEKSYQKGEKQHSYIAFHGELICPPPDGSEINS